jgi:hypothetical protein
MSYIIFGGLKYHQVRHAIYCKKCKDTIESKYINDCKYCSCSSVGIDGGPFNGNRILGNMPMIEDRSMYCAIINNGKYKLWLPEYVITERFNYLIKFIYRYQVEI